MTTCPQCRRENGPGRRFCGQCGLPLGWACPACGFPNDSSDRFCGGCGAPLAAAAAGPPAAPGGGPGSGGLESERKQVTVLFADLRGSLELLAERDPEDARALLDPVLELMMSAVHRYEGTVNQVMGDGIMAIFGAPRAHEDHAVRACHAALHMHEDLRRHAEAVAAGRGAVQIRVGLNSGEVVVRSIGSDLHMDYSAIGQTTHLAARMEQLAEPGTTLLTAETARLADGFVRVEPLGPQPVKGLAAPVPVFRLVGRSPMRSRLQAASERGLTRFVGREAEMGRLDEALALAEAGAGRAVALVGGAGVGKSRIVHECVRSERTRGWLVLEASAVAHGQATPFHAVVELLRAYFKLEPTDDASRIRATVTSRVLGLDPRLGPSIPAFLALLGAEEEAAGGWAALDPPQRRQRILQALVGLAARESRAQPLLVVLDDLQWIDSETEALLDSMIDALPTARGLILLTYRAEYRPDWRTRPHVVELSVDPLGPDTAERLLDAVVGGAPELGPLKQLLIERTEGNPFFLEESVRALVELGVLAGRPGARRLARPVTAVPLSPTVHAVLAARIDRLSPEDKHLLQCAAVAGTEARLGDLLAIADRPEAEVRRGLDRLREAGFLVETRAAPEPAHAFRHGLTHEVAYQGLLHDRRRALHARIAQALAGSDRAHDVERLAHHAFRGERWEPALGALRQAGQKAAAHSAHRQAAARFEEALDALGHLPATPAMRAQGIDVRLELRNALFVLGELPRIFDHLRAAEATALELGDRDRLGRVLAAWANSLWAVGDAGGALEAGRRVLAIADAGGDPALGAVGRQYLGQAHHALGDYPHAIECLREAVEALQGSAIRRRVGMASPPALFSRTWLVWCLAERGEFDEARRRVEEALQIAARSEQLYSVAQAHFSDGMLAIFDGRIDASIAAFERARSLCHAGNLRLTLAMTEVPLGRAYTLAGRVDEAIAVLEPVTATCAAMRFRYSHVLGLAWLSQAYTRAGRAADAGRAAADALDGARAMGARGLEARALRSLAELHGARPGGAADAERLYGEVIALAESLEMAALRDRCRQDLGALGAHADRNR